MIRYEYGTATVTIEPRDESRHIYGTLTVHYDYAPDDLLRAVVAVLVVLGDKRAPDVDALIRRRS